MTSYLTTERAIDRHLAMGGHEPEEDHLILTCGWCGRTSADVFLTATSRGLEPRCIAVGPCAARMMPDDTATDVDLDTAGS